MPIPKGRTESGLLSERTVRLVPPLRYALKTDLKWIAAVAKQNTEELGFLPDVVIKKEILKDFIIVHPELYAFVLFQLRRDGVTTIQYLCTQKFKRGKGVGRMLVDSLPRPIQLKCPAFIQSNEFYRHLGFVHQGFEQSSKRPVNVWRLET